MQPRCSRDAAEMRPRCGRDAAEMLPGYGLDYIWHGARVEQDEGAEVLIEYTQENGGEEKVGRARGLLLVACSV